MYNQREIILIPFPYSDLTFSKKRPALIISNNSIKNFEDLICVLVTSKIHKDDILIKKENIEKGSLPFKSAIKPHRIFTIDKRIIVKRICKIDKKLYKEVFDRINEFIR